MRDWSAVEIIRPRAALVLVDLQPSMRTPGDEAVFAGADALLAQRAADFCWVVSTERILADGSPFTGRDLSPLRDHGAVHSAFARTTVDTRGHIVSSTLGCSPVYVLGTGAARIVADELLAAGVAARLLDPS